MLWEDVESEACANAGGLQSTQSQGSMPAAEDASSNHPAAEAGAFGCGEDPAQSSDQAPTPEVGQDHVVKRLV
jgi:hypothetical protein